MNPDFSHLALASGTNPEKLIDPTMVQEIVKMINNNAETGRDDIVEAFQMHSHSPPPSYSSEWWRELTTKVFKMLQYNPNPRSYYLLWDPEELFFELCKRHRLRIKVFEKIESLSLEYGELAKEGVKEGTSEERKVQISERADKLYAAMVSRELFFYEHSRTMFFTAGDFFEEAEEWLFRDV
jgi:hypothetical protein